MRRVSGSSGDFGIVDSEAYILHGSGRRFEQRLHGKKEEYLIKTVTCFCIFRDPRAGYTRVVIGIPCL